jgi:hypothetical protein
MRETLVEGRHLDAFLEGLPHHGQYWQHFISMQAWLARGCEPGATPGIMGAASSTFWLGLEDECGEALLLVAWHDFDPIDRTIELSVGLHGATGEAALSVLERHLPQQYTHVARTVGIRRVVSMVDARLVTSRPWMRVDGVVPRLLSDGRGVGRDVAVCSASANDLAERADISVASTVDRVPQVIW